MSQNDSSFHHDEMRNNPILGDLASCMQSSGRFDPRNDEAEEWHEPGQYGADNLAQSGQSTSLGECDYEERVGSFQNMLDNQADVSSHPLEPQNIQGIHVHRHDPRGSGSFGYFQTQLDSLESMVGMGYTDAQTKGQGMSFHRVGISAGQKRRMANTPRGCPAPKKHVQDVGSDVSTFVEFRGVMRSMSPCGGSPDPNMYP